MIIKRSLVMFVLFLLVTLPFSLAETFTYDSNGNMIQGVDHKYTYDAFNNLIEVNYTNGTLLEEYIYDDEGQRIKKYEPATDTTTYYLDKTLIRTVNSTGTFDTYYYYDNQGTLLSRKDPDGSKYYYHPDHLGSTSLVTDEAGDTVEETKYEPFGGIHSGGSDRYTFTGQELDDSGLMYYGARYYDTNLRQFVQPDFLIQDLYYPQNLNRYSYVLNNPYRFRDSSGNYIEVMQENGQFVVYQHTISGGTTRIGTISQQISSGFIRNLAPYQGTRGGSSGFISQADYNVQFDAGVTNYRGSFNKVPSYFADKSQIPGTMSLNNIIDADKSSTLTKIDKAILVANVGTAGLGALGSKTGKFISGMSDASSAGLEASHQKYKSAVVSAVSVLNPYLSFANALMDLLTYSTKGRQKHQPIASFQDEETIGGSN